MINKGVVEDILARTEIQPLISSYVSLKRAGSLYRGLCPFHSEKSPSFTVYPSDNSFYCFGCGIGGSAITFLKKIENLDFEDAVEELGKRVGVTVIREGDNNYEVSHIDKKRYYEMNADAARFFNSQLLENNDNAKKALSYFTEKRQLSLATIKRFGLGYSPSNASLLVSHLHSLGYTDEEMIKGYLCGKDSSGRMYTFYRNRVMFPIIDVSGNVIAFGGRVLDDSKPKYLNSSDTPVFNKRRNLFALNFARHSCSESIILCEGYMDVIAMHAADFTNAVATLGTAITPEQARLMKRYTKKVIISYDTDEAGRNAADKATRLLEEAGVEVKLLTMPQNCGAKDPDEYLRKYGKESFEKIILSSLSKFNYYFERSLVQHNIQEAPEKVKVLNEMFSLIATFNTQSERDIYLHAVADKLGIDKESIKKDFARRLSRIRFEINKEKRTYDRNQVMGIGDKVNSDFVKAPTVARMEESVLGLLLLFENHRKLAFSDKYSLCEEDFYTSFGKRVFKFIKNAKSADDINSLDIEFSPEEVGRITKIKRERMELTDNGDKVLEDCINSLRLQLKDKQINDEKMSISGLDDLLKSLRKDT